MTDAPRRRRGSTRSRDRSRAAALLVALVLALASPWRPGGSSDGIAVFRTSAALAFEGTFVLPKAPPGARIDPFYFPPSPDGTGIVSIYAPFGALLGAAQLRAAALAPSAGSRGALADLLAGAAPIVATALAVFPIARLLRHGGARRRAATALAAGLLLGTFLGPLGVTDFQEPWLVLFVSSALERALASRLLRGGRRLRCLAAAGAAISLALLAKPTAAALLPVLSLPALFPRRGEPRGRGLVALVLGAAPGVGLALALNAVRFGSALDAGYATPLLHPLARAVSPAWTLLRLTLLPNRGLLWYAPLLLLVPLVAPRLARGGRRVVLAASAAGFGVFLAANLAWFAWEGGFGWGPRLLAPAVACAAPLLAARGRELRWAAALVAVGLLANLPAWLVDPGRLYRVAAAADEAAPLGPIVPLHRRDGGKGGLEPLQRPHYVPAFAPALAGPGLLARLVLEGDGEDAGAPASGTAHDAALVRRLLGAPAEEGSGTARLLLVEARVTAGSDPARARRMEARAGAFGAPPPPAAR